MEPGQNETAPKKKKVFGKMEWIFLLLSVGVLGYIFMQKKDIKMIERTEEMEVLDKPDRNGRHYNPKKTSARTSKSDDMLTSFAERFKNNSQLNVKDEVEYGLSSDERKYYENVRNEFSSQVKKTSDWLSLLKTSHSTYQKVQSFFGNDKTPTTKNINGKEFQSHIKNQFDLDDNDYNRFTNEAKSTIGDVANFIMGLERNKTGN